ncbi:hypothetical protein GCM10023155_28780 [Bremerella cremea]
MLLFAGYHLGTQPALKFDQRIALYLGIALLTIYSLYLVATSRRSLYLGERGVVVNGHPLAFAEIAAFTYTSDHEGGYGIYTHSHHSLAIEQKTTPSRPLKFHWTSTTKDQPDIDAALSRLSEHLATEIYQAIAKGDSVVWTNECILQPEGLKVSRRGDLPVSIAYSDAAFLVEDANEGRLVLRDQSTGNDALRCRQGERNARPVLIAVRLLALRSQSEQPS